MQCSEFLTLPQAAAVLGKGGKKPSTCTVWRWCRKGCGGVKLQYLKFGREIRVTREALAEFGRAMAEADKPLGTPPATLAKPKPRTPEKRARDIAAAETFLKNRGVML